MGSQISRIIYFKIYELIKKTCSLSLKGIIFFALIFIYNPTFSTMIDRQVDMIIEAQNQVSQNRLLRELLPLLIRIKITQSSILQRSSFIK